MLSVVLMLEDWPLAGREAFKEIQPSDRLLVFNCGLYICREPVEDDGRGCAPLIEAVKDGIRDLWTCVGVS